MSDFLRHSQVGADALPTLHYIPDYVSADEEQRLLTEVHASQAKWVQLSGRRLQNHGGVVHTKGLIPAPMPRWLEQLCSRLHQQLPLFGDSGPNHVLINSYRPGNGIMPHQDGPLYHPVVCILSLGSPAVLRFWRKQPEGGTGGLPPVASLLAMPRSLLVFQDDAYHDCLHGIEEVTEEALDPSVVNPEAALQPQQPAQPAIAIPDAPAGHHIHTAAGSHHQQDTSSNIPSSGAPLCVSAGAAGAAGTPATLARQGERVSLTIRRVLRVHKALGIFKR